MGKLFLFYLFFFFTKQFKAGFLPGKGAALKIRTKTGSEYVLKHFANRKAAVQKILDAARSNHIQIAVLRDGLPETKEPMDE